MMIMNKTCRKFGKMVEMMRAKVEEVRRGMNPLVNIVKEHLKCYHCNEMRMVPVKMIIVRMTTMKVKRRRFSLINILNCKVIITRMMMMLLLRMIIMMKESFKATLLLFLRMMERRMVIRT